MHSHLPWSPVRAGLEFTATLQRQANLKSKLKREKCNLLSLPPLTKPVYGSFHTARKPATTWRRVFLGVSSSTTFPYMHSSQGTRTSSLPFHSMRVPAITPQHALCVLPGCSPPVSTRQASVCQGPPSRSSVHAHGRVPSSSLQASLPTGFSSTVLICAVYSRRCSCMSAPGNECPEDGGGLLFPCAPQSRAAPHRNHPRIPQCPGPCLGLFFPEGFHRALSETFNQRECEAGQRDSKLSSRSGPWRRRQDSSHLLGPASGTQPFPALLDVTGRKSPLTSVPP